MTCLLNGESYDVVDLFGGPGGMDLAISALGFRPIGIEWDADACETRLAAGLGTIHADVSEVDPTDFAGVEGLAGSPPCQSFSRAGDRLGALDAPAILDLADRIRRASTWIPYEGEGPCGRRPAVAEPVSVAVSLFGDEPAAGPEPSELDDRPAGSWHDDRSPLVLEPLRYIDALRPEWVVLEQVTDVLPLWRRFGLVLEGWGYQVWTGILLAADYGVAQTRERAFLIASRVRPVGCPPPTHAKNPGLLEERPLFRWWAMAEALGWGLSDEPAGTLVAVADGGRRPLDGGSGGREKYRRAFRDGRWIGDWETDDVRVETGANSMVTGRTGSRAGDGDVRRYSRPVTEPAPTLDTKVGRAWRIVVRNEAGEDEEVEVAAVNTGRNWQPGGTREDAQVISTDEPAPTVSAKAGGQWHLIPGGSGYQSPNRRTYAADEEPAPTIGFGHDAAGWAWTRPATTLMGDPRIPQPGHKKDAAYPDAPGRMEGSLKITEQEALILQSFPPDYPLRGTQTAQFRQVGDAVPPLLGLAVVEVASGRRRP